MSASKLVGVIVLATVLSAWAYIALTGEPRLQIGVANGTYSNRCCGSVVLNNGIMIVAKQHIGYVIEQDKLGPYLLPESYVGASSKGLVIKSGEGALKLRLDGQNRPLQVQLLNELEGRAYSFVRVNGS